MNAQVDNLTAAVRWLLQQQLVGRTWVDTETNTRYHVKAITDDLLIEVFRYCANGEHGYQVLTLAELDNPYNPWKEIE